MFKFKYKVIEIRESGARITHYLCGKKKDVIRDIETFKNNCKDYEIVNKEAMIVWT